MEFYTKLSNYLHRIHEGEKSVFSNSRLLQLQFSQLLLVNKRSFNIYFYLLGIFIMIMVS